MVADRSAIRTLDRGAIHDTCCLVDSKEPDTSFGYRVVERRHRVGVSLGSKRQDRKGGMKLCLRTCNETECCSSRIVVGRCPDRSTARRERVGKPRPQHAWLQSAGPQRVLQHVLRHNSLVLILLVTVSIPLWGATDDAVHVEYSIRTPIPRRNLKLAPSGNEHYVSVQGDDQNPGTRQEPFRNIQRFADIAQPGGTGAFVACASSGSKTRASTSLISSSSRLLPSSSD